MKLYEIANTNYIVAEDTKIKKYILKDGKDFYQLDSNNFNEIIGCKSLIYKKDIKDNIELSLIMLCVILFVSMLYLKTGLYTIIDKNIFIATLLLVINIPIHELGHIICLKLFCPSAKITAGFKFVFIYPAIFIDTSNSYLVPKYKRIAIYLAGNFMNCLFLLIIYFFFPALLPYCYLIISNIFINFIPIVKSDGYYAFETLINQFHPANSFLHTSIEDFVRGLLMFLFLEVISYIF